MLTELVAVTFSNDCLRFFDFRINKLHNLAALQTHQMIMMLTFTQLIGCSIRVKMVSDNEAGTFKLCKNAVHGRKTDIEAVGYQLLEYFFSRNMTIFPVVFFRPLLKELEDPQSGSRCLKTGVL